MINKRRSAIYAEIVEWRSEALRTMSDLAMFTDFIRSDLPYMEYFTTSGHACMRVVTSNPAFCFSGTIDLFALRLGRR